MAKLLGVAKVNFFSERTLSCMRRSRLEGRMNELAAELAKAAAAEIEPNKIHLAAVCKQMMAEMPMPTEQDIGAMNFQWLCRGCARPEPTKMCVLAHERGCRQLRVQWQTKGSDEYGRYEVAEILTHRGLHPWRFAHVTVCDTSILVSQTGRL
jgi:hypothetical protein